MIYYKKHGVLLHETRDWEWEKYKADIEGKGDCENNSLDVVIDYLQGKKNEHYQIANREEAEQLVLRCKELLERGRRWPEELDNNELDYLYRSPYSLTRDAYVRLYVAAKLFFWRGWQRDVNWEKIIKDIKPPNKLYTPTFWSWRKALLGKKNCYWFWRKFQNSKIEYVARMQNLMKSLV